MLFFPQIISSILPQKVQITKTHLVSRNISALVMFGCLYVFQCVCVCAHYLACVCCKLNNVQFQRCDSCSSHFCNEVLTLNVSALDIYSHFCNEILTLNVSALDIYIGTHFQCRKGVSFKHSHDFVTCFPAAALNIVSEVADHANESMRHGVSAGTWFTAWGEQGEEGQLQEGSGFKITLVFHI